MIKSNISKVEKITAIMIKQCSQQLVRQKDSIINELKSSEEKLLKNIKLNPKLWNTECISIAIDTKKSDPSNFGLSASIELNNPQIKKLNQSYPRDRPRPATPELNRKSNDNARNYAETVKFREQDESIDLTDKVR